MKYTTYEQIYKGNKIKAYTVKITHIDRRTAYRERYNIHKMKERYKEYVQQKLALAKQITEKT